MTIKKKIILTFAVIILTILFIATYQSTRREDNVTRFQNAINNADVKTIEYFLADTVRIEIDGTECCGDLTKLAALEQLKFGTIKYDFDQSKERIKKIKINFPNYFKEHYIGLDENGNGISYRLNKGKKVDFISSFSSATKTTNENEVNPHLWKEFKSAYLGYVVHYPPTWKKAEVKGNRHSAMFTEQQEYIDFYVNNNVKTKLPAVGFYVEVARSEPAIPKGMQEREALKLEQGRTALPLIEERYLTMNSIPTYRARREFKKGDLLLDEKTPYDGIKRTQLEYTFLQDRYLYRLWATIDNDNPEVVVQQIDKVAKTFQFTRR